MKMNKLGLICAGATLLSPTVQAEKKAKPNFVIILIDDMGWNDWGSGTDFYETPNLNRFAKEGVYFNNGYMAAANCAPSRACLITGQYTPRHNMYNVFTIHRGKKGVDRLSLNDVTDGKFIPNETQTFGESMQEAGYKTAMYGKWHVELRKDKSTFPPAQGFDDSIETHARELGKLFKNNNDPKQIFTYTKRAMQFMDECTQSKDPFMVYLAHHAVHAPNQATAEMRSSFKKKEPGKIHSYADYGAMLKHTDTSLGMLMDKIKALGIDDNTMVVFMSDNGGTPHSSQLPLRAFKGSYYEGGIRVPFIIRWPGTIKPAVNSTPVISIDLFPTMLDLAGGELPKNHPLDGVSLAGLLTKGEPLKERSLFWHCPSYLKGNPKYTGGRDKNYRHQPISVMRKGDWKIHMYLEEWSLDGGRAKIDTNNAIEVYNLKEDPSETTNLALTNKAKRDELLDELLAWQKSINATIPKEKRSTVTTLPKKKKRNR